MASDLNEVRIEGGITQDPQTGFHEQSGAAYWRSTVAVDGTRYDAEQRKTVAHTTFVYCTANGYPAESLIEMALGKGDKIRVEGEIANRVKEVGGVKETKTHIDVKLVHILRKRSMVRAAPPQQGGSWSNEQPGGYAGGPDSEPPF